MEKYQAIKLMQEIDIATIKKRSVQGILVLTSRNFIIHLMNFAVNFILTVILSPAVFGIFFVVSAIISFLSYFSDIGLAAALIQKKDSLTDDDLKTTFTIQQILVISAVLIAFLMSGWVGEFYNLEKDGIQLFQALALAFFFSSLKTIPSVILERNLQFQKLIIPQIVETVVFNTVVLVLAFSGFEIRSFIYAVLARGISGLLAMYIIAPWRIKIGFSKSSASKLLSFGIPFQLNSFLALLKDDLLTIYLGKVLPLTQVGFIGFAQKWAFYPLRLIMDSIIRITFPSFSRLQHERSILGMAVEKSLFVTSFFVFPALTGLIILSPYFIDLIPKYQKWEPALLSLSFFAVHAAFSSISTPLTNALNAIGKIKITLYLMIFWTVATWVLTPIFIILFGFNGVAISSMVITFSAIFVVYITKKYIDFDIFKTIKNQIIATSFMGLIIYFLSPLIVKSFPMLLTMVIIGSIIYLGSMFLLAKAQILSDIKLIRQSLEKS